MLFVGAEPHHPLDTGAVVPGAVEHDDLPGGGQMLHVSLEVPLGRFTLGRLLQRDHPGTAWIQMLHEAFDGAALARRIAPFEDEHVPAARALAPLLELQQLDLQQPLLQLVLVATHALVVRIVLTPGVDDVAPGKGQEAGIVIIAVVDEELGGVGEVDDLLEGLAAGDDAEVGTDVGVVGPEIREAQNFIHLSKLNRTHRCYMAEG